jgi:hypothetical protein
VSVQLQDVGAPFPVALPIQRSTATILSGVLVISTNGGISGAVLLAGALLVWWNVRINTSALPLLWRLRVWLQSYNPRLRGW